MSEAVKEADEITRVIVTVLREKLCRVDTYEWGFDVGIKSLARYPWRIRPESCRVECDWGTVNIGKKRMAQILQAIKESK